MLPSLMLKTLLADCMQHEATCLSRYTVKSVAWRYFFAISGSHVIRMLVRVIQCFMRQSPGSHGILYLNATSLLNEYSRDTTTFPYWQLRMRLKLLCFGVAFTYSVRLGYDPHGNNTRTERDTGQSVLLKELTVRWCSTFIHIKTLNSQKCNMCNLFFTYN